MYGLLSDEWRDLILSVNTHRGQRRLSPAQVAELVQRALGRTKPSILASALGFRDTSMVREFLSLNVLDDDLKELVAWGKHRGAVSMRTASRLARLGKPEAIRAAFQAAIEHELTKDEAQQIVQAYSRGSGPIGDCVDAVLRMRPRVERREVILGAIVLDDVATALSSLPPHARGSIMQRALRRLFPDVRFLGGALGPSHFSLVLEPEQSRVLRDTLDGRPLEDVFSNALAESLRGEAKNDG